MSVSHYQITLTKTKTYVFVSDSGYTYEVYFDRESSIFPDEEIDAHSVFFGFNCNPQVNIFKRNHDPLVGETIMYIIANFFRAYPHSILSYVCSAANGQGRHRQIAFSRWYGSSLLKEKYKLLKRNFGTTYCGVLYSTNHPDLYLIEDLFMDLDLAMKPGVMEDQAPYYYFSEDEEE